MAALESHSHTDVCFVTSRLALLRIIFPKNIHFSSFVERSDRPSACGAIAQLGERLPCTQEVSGSIPLGSTISLLGKTMLVMNTVVGIDK